MSNYVTAIGLDVHARSISACAFDPMTGEVSRARFGYDPASVAEWALGFESPKAVYESGPTGFHLCRALRALGLDCAVAAVSKMHRPAADRGRKNDRRDAEWLARLLACRNVVEVRVPDDRTEAARDLSRALEDAREDLQRAKQRMSKSLLRHGPVFDETTPTGRRRSNWTEAYWKWAKSIEFGEADDAAAYEHYMDAVDRCGEAKRELERKVEEAAARPEWAPTVEAVGRPFQFSFWAAGDRHARHKTAIEPEAPSRSNEMRFRPADIRVPNVRRADTPSSGASPG